MPAFPYTGSAYPQHSPSASCYITAKKFNIQLPRESRHISQAAISTCTKPRPSRSATRTTQTFAWYAREKHGTSMALSSSNASFLQDSISPPRHGSWRWLFAGFESWVYMFSHYCSAHPAAGNANIAVGLNPEVNGRRRRRQILTRPVEYCVEVFAE